MVKRHPLIAFFVLTFLLSWWPWALYAFGLMPVPIASFGPFLAALVVLALTEGKAGIVALLRRMIRWRVGLGWWVVALLLPAAMSGGATLLNIALGAEAPTAAELGRWTAIPGSIAIVLLVPGFGGAWEEPGWRGYALPRLQARWSALASALVLGALITLWHLPLMATGEIHTAEVASIMTAVLVLNWLFNQVQGSVLVLMVCHAANNAFSGRYFFPMLDGADAARQSWLLALTWGAVAVVLLVVGGPRDLSRRRPRQVEPNPLPEPADHHPRTLVPAEPKE
jgi:membrane protease YdiL (CAAX protease family)